MDEYRSVYSVDFREMAKQPKQIDWYSVLGASPTDGLQELKQKYQKLVLLVGIRFIISLVSSFAFV